ncbi:tetratricopeptide repeat protein [Patescibacteria group bacterium]|nr:tetratricopeptide repeat protein [Patescibacteria group bacterium]MBU1682634.1 tetratricopeptide repeat protein [Patescibacteria group bacterium]MBU1934663.1 tetratricopeptide repeat protein [Patescibacteria group bacterium]
MPNKKPDTPTVYDLHDEAIAHYLSGRLSEALPLLKKVLEMDPGNILARHNLMCCLTVLGRSNDAIALFEELLETGEEILSEADIALISRMQVYLAGFRRKRTSH